MWFYKNDNTRPVLTSDIQIRQKHRETEILSLPKTAILVYMSGIEYIAEKYNVELISEKFPRFLNPCPIYIIKGENNICFLDGGRGAPMAADTIEVLKALGVNNVFSIGLIGGFNQNINIGDIVIPCKAYIEEGTSLHYYEKIEYSEPDAELSEKIMKYIPNHVFMPVVSCDAIYRQTFYKQKIWREKGCVGVDMETSTLFSVGKYLNLRVAALLMVSDKSQANEDSKEWDWKMNNELRKKFLYQAIDAILTL